METAETLMHSCEYCQRSFARSASLAVHVCEPKRRHGERDESGVRIGFNAWLRFYEITQGSSRLRTWDDFVKSSYYKAFVKFGRYCVNTRVINPQQFLEWLLQHNTKIDRWASDQIYTQYLIYYLTVESVSDALTRSLEFGHDWAMQHQAQANDCLRFGSTSAMCQALVSGRISPWVIYNCESGQKFLRQLSSEQISMIWPYIDSDRWQKRFADYPADQAYAQEMLLKSGW